jgi:anti-sigma factor RsiW
MRMHEASTDLHERALWLIDRERVEGLEPEERRWLQDHLAGCEACAARSASTEAAVRGLKSVSVPLPPGLAASTNLRVRKEVADIKQRRTRTIALIAGCAASWTVGVASAPLVWRLCEWLGTTLSLPRIVWELGFLSWWLVPAASAGLVVLWARSRAEREELNGRLELGRRSNGW